MSRFRMVAAAMVLALSAGAPAQAPSADEQHAETVLFVCEHGSVKSLLAKLLFEQAAAREGLTMHAASRGIAPDAAVPDWMRAALEQEGFDIGSWQPTLLSESDMRAANRVVTFDLNLLPDGEAEIEHWDGLPSVSNDYAGGRNAIAARVEQLVAELSQSSQHAAGQASR